MTQDELIRQIDKINDDSEVHGVLMFRPLPSQIDDEAVRNELAPEKDVDGITDGSMAGVYSGSGQGYPPCTAEACIQILVNLICRSSPTAIFLCEAKVAKDRCQHQQEDGKDG